MAPSLSPGDRLYVDPIAYAEATPRRGDVVVVRDPEVPSRFLVKRIGALAGEIPPDGGAPVPVGSIWLEGDWSTVSRDSRRFGAVRMSSVLGRAWWRYHPPERVGPVEGGPAIP